MNDESRNVNATHPCKPVRGDHRNNAFWDNLRVDGDEPIDLRSSLEEDTAQFFDSDPFVDASHSDYRLVAPTAPGEALDNPFANLDFAGNQRGSSGQWSRGAFEFPE